MGKQLGEVEINNMSGTKKWIVARPIDNELWYYANYDDPAQAREIAKLFDGIVVRRVEE